MVGAFSRDLRISWRPIERTAVGGRESIGFAHREGVGSVHELHNPHDGPMQEREERAQDAGAAQVAVHAKGEQPPPCDNSLARHEW
jgi:hypothetical protein